MIVYIMDVGMVQGALMGSCHTRVYVTKDLKVNLLCIRYLSTRIILVTVKLGGDQSKLAYMSISMR